MAFGEGAGAIGWLVGEPNEGLACMFTMMNHARLNVGLEGVGHLRARLPAGAPTRSTACRARRGPRDAPSATIIGHPDVRRMLMDMKARIEAMRALAYYTAGQMDRAHGHKDGATRRTRRRWSTC